MDYVLFQICYKDVHAKKYTLGCRDSIAVRFVDNVIAATMALYYSRRLLRVR